MNKLNLRHFKNIIIHHKDFSHNVDDKFEDGTYDFVYIDADHSYESVKKDIELYLPKLKKVDSTEAPKIKLPKLKNV